MSDFKSKLPDVNELKSMTTKFLTAVTKTVKEIADDYRKKRETTCSTDQACTTKKSAANEPQPTAAPIKPADTARATTAATPPPTASAETIIASPPPPPKKNPSDVKPRVKTKPKAVSTEAPPATDHESKDPL